MLILFLPLPKKGLYATLSLLSTVFVLARGFMFAMGALKASRKMHKDMLERVIRSPTSFYDTTPMGRVLNRFSKDIYTIDETLPRTLMMLLSMMFTILMIILAILIIT